MKRQGLGLVAMMLGAGLIAGAATAAPLVDYHQHLLSPGVAAHLPAPAALSPVPTPAAIAALIKAHEAGWNNKDALAPLYADDALLFDPDSKGWTRGGAKAAEAMGERFGRPYQLTVIDVREGGATAQVSGHFTRGDGAERRAFGAFQAGLVKGADGAWKFASLAPVFGAPERYDPLDAKALIANLDEAGINKAVILSLAYMYGSPLLPPVANEYDRVREESDWTVAQAALYPGRLIAFCSINPVKDYAAWEVARCAGLPGVKGIKIHIGNSSIDLKKPDQAAKVRAVFAEANRRKLVIVAHLWTSLGHGKPEAEAFLTQVLPGAPDVPVQIAHMAGGGPGWTDPALEVLTDAIEKKDPRVRNLYVDVATVADLQTAAQHALMAKRIRQIGVDRVLYGSDASIGGRNTARQEWGNFRGMVPLTDAEFKAMETNVTPWAR